MPQMCGLCLILAINLIWFVSLINSTDCNGQDQDKPKLLSIRSVPRYRLVSYLVQKSEMNDARVSGLSIPQQEFYTHVHFAWEKADQLMSVVALEDDGLHHIFVGSNLVFSTKTLTDLYAPGNISAVIDFAITCYAWAIPKPHDQNEPNAYVSTLRVYNNPAINRRLIQQTTARFLSNSAPGSYHFVWEDNSTMNGYMLRQNYTLVACGNSPDRNPCDWKRVGLAKQLANNLCLYRIWNPLWTLAPLEHGNNN